MFCEIDNRLVEEINAGLNLLDEATIMPIMTARAVPTYPYPNILQGIPMGPSLSTSAIGSVPLASMSFLFFISSSHAL